MAKHQKKPKHEEYEFEFSLFGLKLKFKKLLKW